MHLHHRLMRMGFDQKQTVNILYAISGLLGITSVMFTKNNKLRSVFSIVVCLLLLGVYLFILSDPEKRNKAGLDRFMPDSSKTKDDEKDQDE